MTWAKIVSGKKKTVHWSEMDTIRLFVRDDSERQDINEFKGQLRQMVRENFSRKACGELQDYTKTLKLTKTDVDLQAPVTGTVKPIDLPHTVWHSINKDFKKCCDPTWCICRTRTRSSPSLIKSTRDPDANYTCVEVDDDDTILTATTLTKGSLNPNATEFIPSFASA